MHHTMRIGIMGVACVAILGLASCGGDDNGGGATPPTTGMPSRGYEAYLQEVVKGSSCETNSPVLTDNVSFQFASDQDTAEPRDLSAAVPGCS